MNNTENDSSVGCAPERRVSPLPCPFCGSIPVVGPQNPGREGNSWGFVKCVNDDCQARPQVYDGERVSDERGTEEYICIAIERWNMRY